MKCSPFIIDGVRMIVCGQERIKACCNCGAPATRECDWKVHGANADGRQATCDRALCDSCTFSPAPEKDLCPDHKKEWECHPANQQRALPL